MSADPNRASDVEAETQRQKTALLYRNSEIVLGVTIVNASLLAYVNITLHASADVAFVWWGILVFITAGGYLLTRRFLAAKPPAAAAPPRAHPYIPPIPLSATPRAPRAVFFFLHRPPR